MFSKAGSDGLAVTSQSHGEPRCHEHGSSQPTTARPTGWFFTRISLFWVGLSFMWGAINIQVLPAVIPEMVGSDIQGTAIGAVVFVGLAIAIVVQPFAGAVSDRAQFRIGRRRPFMLAGVLFVIPFLVVIGLSPYYWLLFLAVVGVQVGGNIAHGPYQGVIPDQVPPSAQGQGVGVLWHCESHRHDSGRCRGWTVHRRGPGIPGLADDCHRAGGHVR